MNIFDYVNSHFTATQMGFIATIAGWVASAFVQALPDPDSKDGKIYRFWYKFFHTLAANIKLVDKQNKEDKAEGMTLFRKNQDA